MFNVTTDEVLATSCGPSTRFINNSDWCTEWFYWSLLLQKFLVNVLSCTPIPFYHEPVQSHFCLCKTSTFSEFDWQTNDVNRNVTVFCFLFVKHYYLLTKYDKTVKIKHTKCYFMHNYQMFKIRKCTEEYTVWLSAIYFWSANFWAQITGCKL